MMIIHPSETIPFVWWEWTGSLPTRLNLVKRHVGVSYVCHVCHGADESIMHALWDCNAVKQV